MSNDDPKRLQIRLPFHYGETVYHRSREEKTPGMVTGFLLRQNLVGVLVTWSDDLREATHYFFELTTEYSPFAQDTDS